MHQHLSNLEKKGYLKRQKNQPRSAEIHKTEKLVSIPLLGRIAAGQPIEAIQNKETIAVPQSKLPFPNDNYYALRVSGDSMADENINDGDIVLVKEQKTAENGQKVVALLDNSEVTLKTFYREKNRIRLQPANKNYAPIVVQNKDIAIQGVVYDVVKAEERPQMENFQVSIQIRKSKSLPLNKLIVNDALAELRKLPDESCDVIIIDPPYNIGKDFGNNSDKREFNEYILWCREWIHESIRVLKPSGTMFIYGFSEILAYLSVEIPINKRWLIWHYTNKNMASVSFWQRSHESIICAWKQRPIFNTDEVREPYTEGFLNGAAGKIRTGKSIGRLSRKGIDTIYKAHENGALPRDVLKIPALAGGAGMVERWFLCKTCNDVFEPRELKKHSGHEIIKHPTQKPLELSRKLIKSAMPKRGGVILVPFVGTGSECVAAKELEQSYIGFEINPDYVRIAEKMIAGIKIVPKSSQ
ncbi:MAG: Modification methylase HpaI [Parcubacteria group bacterium Gr01-1014_72]|nr:MAG: Modification methylase HpaI [Parcubacteria group bacterium Gr01-1014_72]